jgi:hypothetical protein
MNPVVYQSRVAEINAAECSIPANLRASVKNRAQTVILEQRLSIGDLRGALATATRFADRESQDLALVKVAASCNDLWMMHCIATQIANKSARDFIYNNMTHILLAHGMVRDAFVATLKTGKKNESRDSNLLQILQRCNLSNAKTVVQHIGDDQLKNRIVSMIFTADLANRDLSSAFETALQLTDRFLRDRALFAVLDCCDTENAKEVVPYLSHSDDQDSVYARIAQAELDRGDIDAARATAAAKIRRRAPVRTYVKPTHVNPTADTGVYERYARRPLTPLTRADVRRRPLEQPRPQPYVAPRSDLNANTVENRISRMSLN